VSGAEKGAERAESRMSGNGAVSESAKKTMERERCVSGALSGRPRSGNGPLSGLNRPLKFR